MASNNETVAYERVRWTSIKELRWRLKVATDALTELQTRLVASVYDGKINPYKALEITERALAAIAEEGVKDGKQ